MGILIENILAVLPESREPKVCNVYIEGSKIAAIDTPPADFKAEKIISGSGKLLIPGLVNAHTHAYMSVFRNCADDLKFNDWLFGRILPMEAKLTGEDAYYGTMLSCIEMISTGTTTFCDMHLFPNDVAKAVYDAGMRAVITRGLVGDKDDVEGGERRIRESIEDMERWKHADTLSFMLAPHAPYTCDAEYQAKVAKAAKKLGCGINVHLSESLNEIETIKERYGCSPVELIDKTGLLTDKTVAAHCVQLSDSDIELMAKRGASVASNPVSNLKLGNGIAPIYKLLQAGVNVSLGTDSSASNNCLNMLRELAFLTLLPKGISGDAAAVSAYEGFRMATVNGAKALGLGGKTGEIKVGLEADLAIIDLDRPNFHPLNDVFAALAYAANGSEVETVLIAGKVLMEKGQFTTIDKEKIYFEVDRISNSVKGR